MRPCGKLPHEAINFSIPITIIKGIKGMKTLNTIFVGVTSFSAPWVLIYYLGQLYGG